MSTLVYLDDERTPEETTWMDYSSFNNIMVVCNTLEFKALVKTFKSFEYIVFSIDHDLQDFHEGEESTGYDCVKWLLDYLYDQNKLSNDQQIYVHSKNPIGKENIETYVKNYINVLGGIRNGTR